MNTNIPDWYKTKEVVEKEKEEQEREKESLESLEKLNKSDYVIFKEMEKFLLEQNRIQKEFVDERNAMRKKVIKRKSE